MSSTSLKKNVVETLLFKAVAANNVADSSGIIAEIKKGRRKFILSL